MDTVEQIDCSPLYSLCDECAKAFSAVDEWLGQAATRQAALDAMWRAMRLLNAAGFSVSRRDALDWRGALVEELWDAGFYQGRDGLMHFDPEKQRRFGDAEGPTLKEVGEFFRQHAGR